MDSSLTNVSPSFAKLLAGYAAADVALDRFYRDAHNPACDRERELLAALPNPTAADVDRIQQESGLAALSDVENEHYAIRKPLKEAVHAYPVESLADLNAKLAFIEQDNGMDGEDLLPLVQADEQRLLGGEGRA
jgi:hypothetical protein